MMLRCFVGMLKCLVAVKALKVIVFIEKNNALI